MSVFVPGARASTDFAAKLAHTESLLRTACAQHGPDARTHEPRLTLACSLGAEDVVLWHLASALGLRLDVFVLDTGLLHAETRALLDRMQQQHPLPVRVFTPHIAAVQDFVTRHGSNAMRQSIELRHACCHLRKLEPLGRALAGRSAWITGLRREQSTERAQVPDVDESDGTRVKFNPLADWTWGDVWHYIGLHQVPYHPLHDAFYPSIGCAPCTRAITPGEDFRAGRWWWESEAAKECGLHSKPLSSHAVAVTRSDTFRGLASAQAHVGVADVKSEGRAEAKTEVGEPIPLYPKDSP